MNRPTYPEGQRIHALTLKQPWPWAFLLQPPYLPKRVENRTWPFPRKFVGQWIALHGGSIPSRTREARDDLARILEIAGHPPVSLDQTYVSGIFALAAFAPAKQGKPGDPWHFGPYGWPLGGFVPLDRPIPCSGNLGVWAVPPGVDAQIREAVPEICMTICLRTDSPAFQAGESGEPPLAFMLPGGMREPCGRCGHECYITPGSVEDSTRGRARISPCCSECLRPGELTGKGMFEITPSQIAEVDRVTGGSP
jgi:hypothetical protein